MEQLFCVVYRFVVKPGREVEFEQVWRELTGLIREHQSSRGSRLHRAADGVFIAYAQWPSRDAWKSPPKLPASSDPIRAAMKDCCASIEVLHELDVVADLLVPS